MMAIVKAAFARVAQLVTGEPAQPSVDLDGNLWITGNVSTGGAISGPTSYIDTTLHGDGSDMLGPVVTLPPGHTAAFFVLSYVPTAESLAANGLTLFCRPALGDGTTAPVLNTGQSTSFAYDYPPDGVAEQGGRFIFRIVASHGERTLALLFSETGVAPGFPGHISGTVSTR